MTRNYEKISAWINLENVSGNFSSSTLKLCVLPHIRRVHAPVACTVIVHWWDSLDLDVEMEYNETKLILDTTWYNAEYMLMMGKLVRFLKYFPSSSKLLSWKSSERYIYRWMWRRVENTKKMLAFINVMYHTEERKNSAAQVRDILDLNPMLFAFARFYFVLRILKYLFYTSLVLTME